MKSSNMATNHGMKTVLVAITAIGLKTYTP